MTDEPENTNAASSPGKTGCKKFAGAKLVPLPMPIPQTDDTQRFPMFLGVGIALSILTLLTVFYLAMTCGKNRTNADANLAESLSASASAVASPPPRESH